MEAGPSQLPPTGRQSSSWGNVAQSSQDFPSLRREIANDEPQLSNDAGDHAWATWNAREGCMRCDLGLHNWTSDSLFIVPDLIPESLHLTAAPRAKGKAVAWAAGSGLVGFYVV